MSDLNILTEIPSNTLSQIPFAGEYSGEWNIPLNKILSNINTFLNKIKNHTGPKEALLMSSGEIGLFSSVLKVKLKKSILKQIVTGATESESLLCLNKEEQHLLNTIFSDITTHFHTGEKDKTFYAENPEKVHSSDIFSTKTISSALDKAVTYFLLYYAVGHNKQISETGAQFGKIVSEINNINTKKAFKSGNREEFFNAKIPTLQDEVITYKLSEERYLKTPATSSRSGIIKVGKGLKINKDGVLSMIMPDELTWVPNVEIVGITPTSASIIFDPFNGQGVVTKIRYSAFYAETAGITPLTAKYKNLNNTKTKITLVDLKPNTTYYLEVVAVCRETNKLFTSDEISFTTDKWNINILDETIKISLVAQTYSDALVDYNITPNKYRFSHNMGDLNNHFISMYQINDSCSLDGLWISRNYLKLKNFDRNTKTTDPDVININSDILSSGFDGFTVGLFPLSTEREQKTYYIKATYKTIIDSENRNTVKYHSSNIEILTTSPQYKTSTGYKPSLHPIETLFGNIKLAKTKELLLNWQIRGLDKELTGLYQPCYVKIKKLENEIDNNFINIVQEEDRQVDSIDSTFYQTATYSTKITNLIENSYYLGAIYWKIGNYKEVLYRFSFKTLSNWGELELTEPGIHFFSVPEQETGSKIWLRCFGAGGQGSGATEFKVDTYSNENKIGEHIEVFAGNGGGSGGYSEAIYEINSSVFGYASIGEGGYGRNKPSDEFLRILEDKNGTSSNIYFTKNGSDGFDGEPTLVRIDKHQTSIACFANGGGGGKAVRGRYLLNRPLFLNTQENGGSKNNSVSKININTRKGTDGGIAPVSLDVYGYFNNIELRRTYTGRGSSRHSNKPGLGGKIDVTENKELSYCDGGSGAPNITKNGEPGKNGKVIISWGNII